MPSSDLEQAVQDERIKIITVKYQTVKQFNAANPSIPIADDDPDFFVAKISATSAMTGEDYIVDVVAGSMEYIGRQVAVAIALDQGA